VTDEIDVSGCTRCPDLCASRSRIVNGTGPTDAELLLVGEAPGRREDETGVRITNCVRCRPPENRDPTAEERANCRSYLEREIDAVDPAVVVAMGKVPAEHLLGRSVRVTAEAGEIAEIRIDGTPRAVLVCVHPAATLYDPSQRETFAAAIGAAAEFAGGGDQSRLGDF